MRLTYLWVAAVLGSGLACSSASSPSGTTAPTSAPAATPTPPGAARAPTRPPGALTAPGAAPTAGSPAASPWTPPSIASCEPAALLVKYDYTDVQRRYCELCKDQDEMACTLDWPSSDVPLCTAYDELRNDIYAYYGYPFTKEEWKTHYAAKSWYKADPSFTDARMSEAAKRNVALLKSKAEKHQDCIAQ